jgi:RNA polymerase-binding transcription factor DksA
MEYKVCSKCGRELPISEFSVIMGNVCSTCKSCQKEFRKYKREFLKGFQESVEELRDSLKDTMYGRV